MKKLTSRIVALALAMVLCLSVSVNAFAAETVELNELSATELEETVSPTSNGDVLYTASKSFSRSGSLTITTTSANWGANIYVKVTGGSGSYYVSMTTPLGGEYSTTVTAGGGYVNIANLVYGAAGTYTFYFTSWSGDSTSAVGYAQIRD